MLYEAVAPYYSETNDAFAVALSGGGDSMALLHALKDAPQLRCALIVDHGLRAESAEEARLTKSRAEKLRVEAHILTWVPELLKAGLQEKARQARYGLMGGYCRREGISSLLTAHHLGDQAETLIMRYDKGTDWRGAAGMSSEKYAPIWPELACVTVCRPLLSVPKNEILKYLKKNSLEWVEDPSNTNRDFTRVRIRQRLAVSSSYLGAIIETAQDLGQAKSLEQEILASQASNILRVDENGYAVLSDVPYPELLMYLLRLVSGTGGPIDGAQIRRVLKKLRRPDFKAVTLAGAQISKFENKFLMCRDPVAAKGRRNKELTTQTSLAVPVNEPFIWDGRFLARTRKEDITVSPLFGQMSKLPNELVKEVKRHPPKVRMTLPVWRAGPNVLGIGVGEFDGLSVECLARERLEAMFGKLAPKMNKNV